MSAVLAMSKILRVLDPLKHLSVCVSMTHFQSHTSIQQQEKGKIRGKRKRARSFGAKYQNTPPQSPQVIPKEQGGKGSAELLEEQAAWVPTWHINQEYIFNKST